MSRAHHAGKVDGARAASWSHVNPVLSSAARGWEGINVGVFRSRNVDFIAQYPDHVISIVLRGPFNLLQRRNGRMARTTMHAGDTIITPVGQPKLLSHREEAEILKVRIDPAFFDLVVAEAGAGAPGSLKLLDNFGTRDAHIEALARALLAEARTEGLASGIYVESLANQLVIHLLRQYSSAKKFVEDPTPLPRYKLDRATDYINDNLREDLRLRDIARTLSMSPYHFAHVFKQTVGLTPHRYVIERRMERAKSLLRDTTLPITQVAHQVGYSNQSHFSTVFHRHTGRSPRGYRRDA